MESEKYNKNNLPSCCFPVNKEDKESKSKGLWQGIMYGTIPHIGCIAFIIGSILGVTILMQAFKPLLMNKNFFYYLILISIGFATLSSYFYLKKHNSLSLDGLKNKKKYLTLMYASTIFINILFFFVIFPFVANINNGVDAQSISGLNNLKLKVDIPCPGHAPLISSELKKVSGVKGVEFSYPNYFNVYYDSSANADEILSLAVFKEYSATIVDNIEFKSPASSGVTGNAIIRNDVQEINMDVDYGYSPDSFVIKKGIPVKWNVNVKQLTGCNRRIVSEELGINRELKQGVNVIEFIPDNIGTISFHCSMNMLKGNFIVTETGSATQQQIAAAVPKSSGGHMGSTGGGCGCGM